MSRRPKNEEELQKREAIGVIRASRFVRKRANSREEINIDVIKKIHYTIFIDAWSEIAGKWRIENLEIYGSSHKPPHYSEVPELMKKADYELDDRLSAVCSSESFWMTEKDLSEEKINIVDKIVESAAWIHHVITYIHPFRDGNGRTARLAANFVLERFGLVGISIRVEQENKKRYTKALAQIDNMRDYNPLKDIIYEGLVERYSGVPMRYNK